MTLYHKGKATLRVIKSNLKAEALIKTSCLYA